MTSIWLSEHDLFSLGPVVQQQTNSDTAVKQIESGVQREKYRPEEIIPFSEIDALILKCN